jgi:PAS domain-containing protein
VYEAGQKNLILILAREFASKLATAMFITDAEGKLVYYNEPAETLLGRTFAEAGEMPAEEWPDLFAVEHLDGRPMALEEMPEGIALLERRPAHGSYRITSLDGHEREFAVTAFPLFARATEFVGTAIFFWEASNGGD